jgi:hypothetical protein
MVKLYLRYKLRGSMGREYSGRWGWFYFSNGFYLQDYSLCVSHGSNSGNQFSHHCLCCPSRDTLCLRDALRFRDGV